MAIDGHAKYGTANLKRHNLSMRTIDFPSLLDIDSPEESRAPPALSGRELQDLVSPIACEEFVNSYFSRLSLNVEGHPQKFDHIFSWDRLRQALKRGKSITDKRHNITASFANGDEFGSPRPLFNAYHDQVSELLHAGATICISNIHMADPFLAQWAQGIRAQLNFAGTVGVHCYVSADNSGLPMHYDRRVATTLQIAGKKRWRFSTEAAMAWPNDNEIIQHGKAEPLRANSGKLPADMEFREVELEPGDLLCLPAGAWHSACGVGYSLALNLYFAPRNFLLLLAPLIQDFAVANEHWRDGAPATAEKIKMIQEFAVANEYWRGGAPASVEKILGKMPSVVPAYMRERFDEFHKMAPEVIDGPDALTEPWLNSLTHEPYTGWQPAPLLPIPGATRHQRFRVEIASLRFIESQDKVIVPCDNGVVKFPATLAPIFQRLSSELVSFSIPEVLSWQHATNGPSQNEIISCLKTLYENGILKMV